MAMRERSKLPIGIQSFAEIREGGYYYADKTEHIERLLAETKSNFLLRPKGFGKSLLLDTVRCLFDGRRDLFEGLYIQDRWDWESTHPVIQLSFDMGVVRSRGELDVRIRDQFFTNRQKHSLPAGRESDIAGEFFALIQEVQAKYGRQAVVLIDEYDKPVLDNILEPERARDCREGLKNLYSVLKDADHYLRLVLITGVSKFSKVSLFSGLNNLRDITMLPEYATVCGYTDEDIDGVFAPALNGLDRDAVRQWYNGYRWGGQEVKSVYNPFDVLLLLQNRRFDSYWFETATPTFLVDILGQRGVFTPSMNVWQTDDTLLNRFDVEDISTDALLFQTGYLTIKQVHEPMLGYRQYTLGFPNQEVESGLNQALLPVLGVQNTTRNQRTLLDRLLNHDLAGLESHLKSLYAGLPFDWYRNNPIAQYEGHYASIFYSHFAALGLNITVEDVSCFGRVDMTVDFGGCIYLFEFKVVELLSDGRAIEQLVSKGYANKYLASGKTIHLIGVEFSKEKRQIVTFDVQTLQTG